VRHVWGKRNAYKVSVGKPERERPLGRPRHRLDDNNKMDVRRIEWGVMGWIDLAQASWSPASCWFPSWLIRRH
jgi:hypothetical protein